MPDLHDQYRTLLDRGMEPHPRLEMFVAANGDLVSWRVIGHIIAAADARDLIVMHVMPWVREKFGLMVIIGEKTIVLRETDIAKDGLRMSQVVGVSVSVLGAIIEAIKCVEKGRDE